MRTLPEDTSLHYVYDDAGGADSISFLEVTYYSEWRKMAKRCVRSNSLDYKEGSPPWATSSCQNLSFPFENFENATIEESRRNSGHPVVGYRLDRMLCAWNKPDSAWAKACIDQREKEMRFTSGALTTPWNRSTHRLGMIWQVFIYGHALTALCLGILVLPAIFTTVMQTRIHHSGLSCAEGSKIHKSSTCSAFVFNKCYGWYTKHPWLRKATLCHHLLMVSSVSFGLLGGCMKMLLRGLTLARWNPFWPNFEMSLQLYLQFVLLGSVCLDSIAQYFLLRIYGPTCPSKYAWQMRFLFVSEGLTFVVCLMGVLIYTLMIEPLEPNWVYVFIFCFQLPLFCLYASRNFTYWFQCNTHGRLARWQSQMNRNAAIMCHVSLSTFSANLFLRMGVPLMVAVIYALCDIGLLLYVLYIENHLGKVQKYRNRTVKVDRTTVLRPGLTQEFRNSSYKNVNDN